MIWARMLAYITGTVDQELLLRNEYLAAENRILRAQILALPPKSPNLNAYAERWVRSVKKKVIAALDQEEASGADESTVIH
jgi:hypothetical protein